MRNTIVAAAALLAGCAAPTHWNKPGATEADFQQAQARCRMHAAGLPREQRPLLPPPQGVAMGDALMEIGRTQHFMADCLTADGWRR
jgi:hypothetical protein